eukprot:TRINITY_DN55418_c0_g1_i1.p1 TRINITY_DN55418_c0_g1~~TRINITY_DN55418_c0_g1_i1.p1  ORF type:complete len:391 (+),score=55.74 TRINITY_DN55418_c0_g1_i1:28-1173(+)
MAEQVVRLDGDAGGGQILRNAFSFAALLGKAINVYNIRGARDPPGLRAQHLTGIKLVSEMVNGELAGAEIGSCEVTFRPGAFNSGKFTVDTGTAGSCTLLLQIAAPVMLFMAEPSLLTARGGTNVDWSPPVDEIDLVLLPLLRRLCHVDAALELVRRGFYPRGGGEIRLSVKPSSGWEGFTLMGPGNVVRIYGRTYAAGAQEIKDMGAIVASAQSALEAAGLGRAELSQVVETRQTANGFGSGITLVAETSTGCLLAATVTSNPKQKLSPAKIGEEVVARLRKQLDSGGCVDEYHQDQLLVFMCLAKGRSQVRVGEITEHTKLAIELAKQLTDASWEIIPDGETNVITCTGIGHAGAPPAGEAPGVEKVHQALPQRERKKR